MPPPHFTAAIMLGTIRNTWYLSLCLEFCPKTEMFQKDSWWWLFSLMSSRLYLLVPKNIQISSSVAFLPWVRHWLPNFLRWSAACAWIIKKGLKRTKCTNIPKKLDRWIATKRSSFVQVLQNHSRHNILVKRRHLHTLTVLNFRSSNIQTIRSENGELFLFLL